jgi:6-phosphogluconate dehydrogenase (decarboxylating)
MHRVLLERRIRDVHTRLVRAREELAVLNEQLAVVQESADEARVRALVSETPLASQEHNEAARHVDAMVRAGDAVRKAIDDLERRQDELLAAVASGTQ